MTATHTPAESLAAQLEAMGNQARAAAHELAKLNVSAKNRILAAMADALEDQTGPIVAENAKDLSAAESNGLSSAMVERLRLTPDRVQKMAESIRQVTHLPDPVGEVLREWTQPNGIRIAKVRVPIGVIGIIYESRPNVTSDAAVLCLKTGNAVILRGGSEAFHSNLAIARTLQEGGEPAGLPPGALQLVPSTDREAVRLLARMDRHLDLIIPRGGHGLIEAVVEAARVPVIKHFHGVCHVYIDRACDPDMAERIVLNAKCQRPGVCNAAETLLVHREIAPQLLPRLLSALRANDVTIRGDAATRKLGDASIEPATEEDWTTEYLDLILSVGVVDSLAAAIAHINAYGSKHSDAIVTSDPAAAERFLNEVDSATVFWNASTRFNDGGEFGFGAEIGISTDKLHARGPMGLEELTSYKYLIRGEGQIK